MVTHSTTWTVGVAVSAPGVGSRPVADAVGDGCPSTVGAGATVKAGLGELSGAAVNVAGCGVPVPAGSAGCCRGTSGLSVAGGDPEPDAHAKSRIVRAPAKETVSFTMALAPMPIPIFATGH